MQQKTQKKRLNIAIITNNYTPYSGGVVSSIDSFVNELHKQEHKAFIITLDFVGGKKSDPYYVIRIPSLFRFLYKKNHMAIPTEKAKKLEEIITAIKPDIIHVQHPFYLCQPAIKIAKKLNIPVIFTYHTIYEKYLHYLPIPQFISRPIVKKIVMSFCKNVDYIISPSNYIKNYLENNNVQTKIEKIPSGILPVFIKDKVYDIEKTEKNEFNLIFVSRFVKEKNIEFLLRMFAKLIAKYPEKNFKLTLAGYGSQYEKIKKFAYKKLKLMPTKIQFIYRPRKEEIADLYLQSDAFIFSSDSDTQGLVLAEAMGCGCPVIALDGPGQRDIIKDNVNGFLCNFESEMIEKIILLESDKKLHKKLRIGALETSKEYHPDVTTNKLLDLYKRLI